MKKILFLLLLLLGAIAPIHAANQKRSGQPEYHNNISYASWRVDSANAYRVVSDDTLFLLDDSATTVAFTTAAVGRNKTSIPGVYDRIPDSLTFLLETHGEGDAVSYEFNFQYSLDGNSGPWFTSGTPDTITIAAAARQLDTPRSRKFIPNAKFRATVKTTTATDTSRVEEVRIMPLFR